LRYHRTLGLDAEQLDELEELIEELLTEPWDKGIGRPKSLSLREAIMVTLLYKRQNLIEEVIADLFGVAQATISGIITNFTPLVAQATEEFRPDAEEAKQMTRGRMALVDGTLWPCWSWEDAPEMWAGKYKTTGHGSLIIGDEFGNIIFVSDPAPGCDHDMKKLKGEVKEILELAGAVIADKGFQGSGYVTPAKKPEDRELYLREHEYNNQISSIRSPIERAVAHLKTWKILFTDYRRPLYTFLDSFHAAIGLYFLRIEFSITLPIRDCKGRTIMASEALAWPTQSAALHWSAQYPSPLRRQAAKQCRGHEVGRQTRDGTSRRPHLRPRPIRRC